MKCLLIFSPFIHEANDGRWTKQKANKSGKKSYVSSRKKRKQFPTGIFKTFSFQSFLSFFAKKRQRNPNFHGNAKNKGKFCALADFPILFNFSKRKRLKIDKTSAIVHIHCEQTVFVRGKWKNQNIYVFQFRACLCMRSTRVYTKGIFFSVLRRQFP